MYLGPQTLSFKLFRASLDPARAWIQHADPFARTAACGIALQDHLSKTTTTWEPFQAMRNQYGIQELMRRVPTGSIICRKAVDDQKDCEFRRVIREEFEQDELKDPSGSNKNHNMDVHDWKRLQHDVGQPAIRDLVKTLALCFRPRQNG